MKKTMLRTAATIVTVAVLCVGTGVNATKAVEPQAEKTISVTGKGSVKAKPDIAYLSLGVQTEAVTLKEAQAENATRMDAVFKAVADLGVNEQDLKTTNYSMYPRYSYGTDKVKQQTLIGYTVSNNISVTVRNIDIVGDVLDKAVLAGANINGNIRFSIADTNALYAKALEEATNNAVGKAKVLANTLKIELGEAVSVTEQDTYNTPYAYAESNKMMSEVTMDAAAPRTPVQAGELEVNATVYVVFAH